MMFNVTLTFEKGNDFLHRTKTTETFKLSQSNRHLGLMVVVGVVLRELGM